MIEDAKEPLQFKALHPRKKSGIGNGRAPTSLAHAKEIIVRALASGKSVLSTHFRHRCLERLFTSVDAEGIARRGSITAGPIHDPEFGTFKYEITGPFEGGELRVVIALDPTHDYAECPLIVFITGYRKE